MHRVPAAALPRLRANRARYEEALEVVRGRHAQGDTEGVLRAATVAANVAWRAPSDLLNDPRLERLVISSVRGQGGAPTVDGGRSSGRVLHVLTQAYLTGGHSRLAWRWIGRDGRDGDVALTNQQSPVPEPLRQAVTASAGRVFDLRADHPDLSERAQALRRLMDRADVVVYHVHPYDAVALAAASLPGHRPPIVFENHADHTFWLGLGGADVVSDNRRRAQQMSLELRGVRPERLALLPLAVDEVVGSVATEQVRAQLGLRPEDVVGLSVASAFKMRPVWGRGFDSLVARALTEFPRLKVVLAGVAAEGPWAELAQRFRGRLLPLGAVPDPAPLYAAADIYLNSYPLPAGTSVLEAAISGLPVLSLLDLAAKDGNATVLQSCAPGLDGVRHAEVTEDDYLRHLRKLVRDDRLRSDRGSAARESVLAAHAGAGWLEQLEALYETARTAGGADLDEYSQPAPRDLDYAAMVLSFAAPLDSTMELLAAAAPLGPQVNGLAYDLFAVSARDAGRPLTVRISQGWEDHPEWTRRLLALAEAHPWLAVSLPFAAGDDVKGSRSVALLTSLLELNGSTLSDCGDISLDAEAPTAARVPAVGEVALTAGALDMVEEFLASPHWRPSAPMAVARTVAV
jgi:glycosyltransferase involved in cell wall biosynthesis